MNEDENVKEQESKEAANKTAHVAGKAAATYFGGPAGGALYNAASNTAVGKKIEETAGKAIQNTPGLNKASQMLNKTGALDAADKGIDAMNGGGGGLPNSGGLPSGSGGGMPGSSGSLPGSGNGGLPGSGGSLPGCGAGNDNSNGNGKGNISSDNSIDIKKITNKYKLKILVVLGGFFALILIIILIISLAKSVGDVAKKFWDGVVDFFTTDQQEEEEDYYETLKEVQSEINSKKGICVDVNLITAALIIDQDFDESLEEGKEIEIGAEEEEDDDGNVINSNDFKKMKKYIKLLANMQIKTKKYSFDKSLKASTGMYCADEESSVLVDSTNESNFERGLLWWLTEDSNIDSSTPELVASHDAANFAAFLAKKANEERNYEYYLYYPAKDIEYERDSDGKIKYDNDGNAITTVTCNEEKPDDTYELSIGDLSSMEDSVFYWNLVNSFIPDYYDEYLPSSEPERTEKIKKIAEDIYLLYKDMGTSMSCSMSTAVTTIQSDLCPDGVTVEGVGTFSLEEYVAGVVTNEAYTSEGIEALKAQAVAARTYAVYQTNYCTKSIANSTSAQTFTQNINDNARSAALATVGQVLTYNGSVFSSQYDSFCYDDNDCSDSKRNSDGTYTVTYTKLPSGETHTITLSDSSQYSRILPGQGHARGMSQLVSYQLASEGMSYTDILSYFYSDGVEIVGYTSTNNLNTTGSASEKLAQLFNGNIPTSATEMQNYLTTISVPVVDINGNASSKSVTLHKDLAASFKEIMEKIAAAGVPIKDVACYNWRSMATSSSRSHHSYGVACDLNTNENAMYENGQIVAGSYYKPGDDPYSFPETGIVVQTFKAYGWTWGGNWNSKKDYMHFSYTGN